MTSTVGKPGNDQGRFEPAELPISVSSRAVSWFRGGTDDIKRLIVVTLGSNLQLMNRKLSVEAVKPFMLRGEEPEFLDRCGFVDDVRTRFEHRDPTLLRIIANAKKIKSLVEGGVF